MNEDLILTAYPSLSVTVITIVWEYVNKEIATVIFIRSFSLADPYRDIVVVFTRSQKTRLPSSSHPLK